MAKIYISGENRLVEGGNDNQLSEFQTGGSDSAAEGSEVVLVMTSDLLDKTVGAQPLDPAGLVRLLHRRSP